MCYQTPPNTHLTTHFSLRYDTFCEKCIMSPRPPLHIMIAITWIESRVKPTGMIISAGWQNKNIYFLHRQSLLFTYLHNCTCIYHVHCSYKADRFRCLFQTRPMPYLSMTLPVSTEAILLPDGLALGSVGWIGSRLGRLD